MIKSDLRFGSLCSGIEAASAAWEPLGWHAKFFAEIEAFPAAVLAHHYPYTPNHGDMKKYREWPDATIDVLVGGTPCQSFSVAGLRKGLADPRGNLALVYLGVLDRYRPRWMVFENVPGLLSQDEGRAFGAFLGGLAELGYGFAYRVLDAQFVRVDGFGRAVPQRRRRVFVVGHIGNWRRAAAVLFERGSLSGNPAPRREAGESVAPTLSARTQGGGGLGTDFDCDGGLIASTLNAGGHSRNPLDETLVPQGVALRGREGGATAELTGAVMTALRTGGGGGDKPHVLLPIAFDETQITSAENRCNPQPGDPSHPLSAGARPPTLAFQSQSVWRVRRLTPTECERLQGFPDGYTAIPYRGKAAADGPRYKALGNSMAVNVMRWIGMRIQMIDRIREFDAPVRRIDRKEVA